jgi:hypothetical protein
LEKGKTGFSPGVKDVPNYIRSGLNGKKGEETYPRAYFKRIL